MHGTLLALILTAYLFGPSGILDQIWNLASPGCEASVSPAVTKEGPGLDPNGAMAPSRVEEGPGLDPDGRS